MEWNILDRNNWLSTARDDFADAGSGTTNALAAGGTGPTAATEEWTGAGTPLTVTFTDS